MEETALHRFVGPLFSVSLLMGWQTKSHLLDGNGSRRADPNATLAAQAFIHIYRLGFTVFDLEYVHRAGIHAFSLSVTLVFIHGHNKHGFYFHLLYGFIKSLSFIQPSFRLYRIPEKRIMTGIIKKFYPASPYGGNIYLSFHDCQRKKRLAPPFI